LACILLASSACKLSALLLRGEPSSMGEPQEKEQQPKDQEQPTTQSTMNPPRRLSLGKHGTALTSPLRPASARLARMGRQQDTAHRPGSSPSSPSAVSQIPATAPERTEPHVGTAKAEAKPSDLDPTELQELVWRLCMENEAMRAELEEGREQTARLEAERDQAQQEADSLRGEVALNQERIAAIEENNKALFAEHSQIRDQARALQAELLEARTESRGSDEQLREARRMLNDTDSELSAACVRRDKVVSQLIETERLLRCEQLENQLMMRAAVEEGIRRRVKTLTQAQERVPVVPRRKPAKAKVNNSFRRRRGLGKVMAHMDFGTDGKS